MDSMIRVLDETTANKIAAGEVVERPSSVIKELVENSIDAQSRNIEVEIIDGGTEYIRVTDDGIGMSPADAKLAILRHATSKIRTAEDLEKINSLGFRGEALPSIASVSKFTMTTRLHTAEMATYLEVQGGKVVDVYETGANVGTTITVSQLFFNTPARQKFLKTPSAESSHIHAVLSKLALSCPGISFRLIKNNKLVFATPGSGRLCDVISSLYGHKCSEEMLPIEYSGEGSIRVQGYLSKPTLLRSSRQWQTFIVNSRVINSRSMAKALDNAYHSLLPKTGYPLAVLVVNVPVDSIDVNVHPQKSEIKFSDEGRVFKTIYHAVSEALKAPRAPQEVAATAIATKPRFSDYHTPTYHQEVVSPTTLWREEPAPITTIRQAINRKEPLCTDPLPTVPAAIREENLQLDSLPQPFIRPLGQIANCYIVAEDENGLYLIDQHAAHERILFERMSRSIERVPVQQLLVPQFFNFDSLEFNLLEENLASFYNLGFTLEAAGPNTMRLTEVPADIPLTEVEAILREILTVVQTVRNPTPQALRDAGLKTAACRAAIKAGDELNMRQMQVLLGELFRADLPYTCPHGRPSIIRFSAEDLAKMFRRT